MEPVSLSLALAFGSAALIGTLARKKIWLRRRVRRAPAVTVARFPTGRPGKLVGTLRLRGPDLRAPFTRRRCAYYVATVEELRNGTWNTIAREEKGVSFVLEDESGRAVVDPTGAEFALAVAGQRISGMFAELPAAEQAFLESYMGSGPGSHAAKTLRYEEAILAEGGRVAVVGLGVVEPDPEGAAAAEGLYRAAPPRRVRMSNSKRFRLLICDDPSRVGP